MPRTLADKRERWFVFTSKPADIDAITEAEANAGTVIRAECDLLASATRLSATGSDTVNEQSFCEASNANVPTTGNAEATFAVFRDIDSSTGLPVALGDALFSAFTPKGAKVWIAKSKGPLHTSAAVKDQPYDWYEVVMDNKQDPTERGGYLKDVIPGFVQDFGLNKKFVEDTSP